MGRLAKNSPVMPRTDSDGLACIEIPQNKKHNGAYIDGVLNNIYFERTGGNDSIRRHYTHANLVIDNYPLSVCLPGHARQLTNGERARLMVKHGKHKEENQAVSLLTRFGVFNLAESQQYFMRYWEFVYISLLCSLMSFVTLGVLFHLLESSNKAKSLGIVDPIEGVLAVGFLALIIYLFYKPISLAKKRRSAFINDFLDAMYPNEDN